MSIKKNLENQDKGENMIEAPDYLPLGSVVSLKGNPQKMLLIGRALLVQNDQETLEYFDYAFCLYPQGLIGDAIIYSNHEEIDEIFFKGFDDDENKAITKKIREEVKKLEVPKAEPRPIEKW